MVDVLVPLGVFAMVVCIVIGVPLARAYARRIEQGGRAPQLPVADLMARLERIEQHVEAMATEIERISEGQRFTTRLLAERSEGTGLTDRGAGKIALPAAQSAPAAPAGTREPAMETPNSETTTVDGTVLLPAARRRD